MGEGKSADPARRGAGTETAGPAWGGAKVCTRSRPPPPPPPETARKPAPSGGCGASESRGASMSRCFCPPCRPPGSRPPLPSRPGPVRRSRAACAAAELPSALSRLRFPSCEGGPAPGHRHNPSDPPVGPKAPERRRLPEVSNEHVVLRKRRNTQLALEQAKGRPHVPASPQGWRGLTHPGHGQPRSSRDGAPVARRGQRSHGEPPARPLAGGLGVLWAGRASSRPRETQL